MPGQADMDDRGGIERHLVTIGIAIVIAILLYIGKTTTETSAQVAVLQSKFEGLEAMRASVDTTRDQVADLRSRTSNLEFRTGEAERAINRSQGQRQ